MRQTYFFIIFIFFLLLQVFLAVNSYAFSISGSCSISTVLKMGSKNAEVQCLQEKLELKTDGVFGRLTQTAVISFQKSHGLAADGIVGPLSRAIFNNLTAKNGNYPTGCNSKAGYSTTTGLKCDGSLGAKKILNPVANNTTNITNNVNNTNPNLKNLDAYITAVKEAALKKGFSQDKISLIENKIRQEAMSSTDFFQEFLNIQKAIYNKKVLGSISKKLPLALLDGAISFIGNVFSAKKTEATSGLPFGGFLTYVNPEICNCPAGFTHLFVALPGGNGSNSNMLLTYANGSEAFLYHNMPESGIATLGFYEPGVPSCWTYVGEGCVNIPSEGQITPEVGSSL